MADQYYFEDGYIDDNYFAYVADAGASVSASASLSCSGDIASTTGYFIPDYIDSGYFVAGVVQEASAALSAAASLTVSGERIQPATASLAVAATATATAGTTKQANIAIDSAMTFSAAAAALKNHTAILDSQSTVSVAADITARTSITLSNIVNLSLQAAKVTGFDTSLSASFGLTVDATEAKLAQATLNSTVELAISAQVANQRPRPFVTQNTPTIDTSNSKFGGASARIGANKQVQYYDSADYKGVQTIDFWFKPDTVSTNQNCVVYLQQDDVTTDDFFLVKINRLADSGSDTQWRVIVKSTIGGTTEQYVSDTYLNWTDFKHIRVEIDDAYYLWVDGGIDTPTSDTSTGAYPNINNSLDLGRNFDSNADGIGYLDELYASTSLLVPTNTTSFTTPTSAYTLTAAQQANTILLAHFDTDFSDDVSEYLLGAASLDSALTLSADAAKTVLAQCTLAASATVVAAVAEIEQGTINLNTQAALSTTAAKTVSATVDISGAASFSVATIAINPGDAYLETFATLSADSIKQVGGTVTATASATLGATAQRTRATAVDVNTTATLAVDAIKAVAADCNLSSTATLAATPGNIKPAASALSAQFALSVTTTLLPERMRLAAWLNTNNTYSGTKTVYDAYNNFYGLGLEVGTGSDFVLVKANTIGDIQWQKSYTNFIDYAEVAEIQYYDEHIYVVLGSRSTTSGETDDRVYIVKINVFDGSVAQSRQILQASLRNARIRNGYLYIAGFSSTESYETRVIRIDLSDLTTNDLSIDVDDGASLDYFDTYIDANSSGEMYLATHAQTSGGTERVTVLQKLDTDGSVLISKLIDYTGSSVLPLDAELDSQGRFLVYISSNSLGNQGIAQFDSSLDLNWIRQIETDEDGTDSVKIAVDADDNVLVLNAETGKVVVIDDTGTKIANYYVETGSTELLGSIDIQTKDQWYLTAGNGYWNAFPDSSDYDQVRNIWLSQTLIEDNENPIYAPEDYAGSDGVFTYETSTVTVTTATLAVTPTTLSSTSNAQFLTNSSFTTSSSDTSFTWTVLARLITGTSQDNIVTATQTIDGNRVRFADTTLSASAALSTSGDRIRFADTTLGVAATLSATGGLLRPAQIDASASATMSVTALRTRDNEFVLDASAVFNSSAERLRSPGAITPSVTATMSVTAAKTTRTTVDIDGVMSFAAVVNAKRTAETQLAASATIAATPSLTAVVAAILNNTTTLTAQAFNTVSFESSISTLATLAVDVDRIRPGTSAISAAATIDEVTVTQTKGFELVTDAEFTLASSVTRIQPAGSGLNTAASLTVVGDRIRFSQAELEAQFAPFYANAYRVVQGLVELDLFVVTVTAGDVIAIDPFRTLLIPQETRSIKILDEDRDLTVEQETRVLEI